MTAVLAGIIGLVVGVVVGIEGAYLLVRHQQKRAEATPWGEPPSLVSEVTFSPDHVGEPTTLDQVDDALAEVRFGPCHPEAYDPRDYDAAMACPHGGGHDLMPGEKVMVIENATAPEGRWLICAEHVFEPRVWEALGA